MIKAFIDDTLLNAEGSEFEVGLQCIPREGDCIYISADLFPVHYFIGHYINDPLDVFNREVHGEVVSVRHDISKEGHTITIGVDFDHVNP